MERQLDHHELSFSKRKFPLYLVLDGVNDPRNVGAFFRLADAVGVNKLFLCSGTPSPPNRMIRKVSRQTDSLVPFIECDKIENAISELKTIENLEVVALEITSSSISLNQSTFKKQYPVAVVVGAEDTGVSVEALRLVDKSIHIPMYGQNSSMNVVVATSMMMQEIVRQFENE